MRLRAAGLLLALTAAFPAAAAAQQMSVASPRSALSETAAPISRRDLVALESRLQHVALLQELYWTEHRTYAADLGALEPTTPGAPIVEITAASSEGWTARAVHPSLPGVGCMMSVVAPARASRAATAAAGPNAGDASRGAAQGKRSRVSPPAQAADRPVLVCDRA